MSAIELQIGLSLITIIGAGILSYGMLKGGYGARIKDIEQRQTRMEGRCTICHGELMEEIHIIRVDITNIRSDINVSFDKLRDQLIDASKIGGRRIRDK